MNDYEKSTFVNLIAGTVSGLLFTLGMCLCLLPGIGVGIAGIVLLLMLIPMCNGLK